MDTDIRYPDLLEGITITTRWEQAYNAKMAMAARIEEKEGKEAAEKWLSLCRG